MELRALIRQLSTENQLRGAPRIHCAFRKSNPNILVVQPAENWATTDVPGEFDGARDRRIFPQR